MFANDNRPPLNVWLEKKLGTRKWVVAFRLTAKLREQGYERAISQEKFTALVAEFNEQRKALADGVAALKANIEATPHTT
jgi:hypothetical protein